MALSDGRFLMHILADIAPKVINWEVMEYDGSDKAKENNAKYVISVARMLNAMIFCVWDQIVKPHRKQMFILFCVLAELKKTYKPSE